MERRAFLFGAIQAGIWLPFATNRLAARAITSPLLSRFVPPNDNVLVMINLNGGNDGLNTLIPFNDAIYYNQRPTLAISKERTLPVTSDLGLHDAMPEFHHLFDSGECAVVQSVGYAGQDRSHFRSTDIWHSAIVSQESPSTGWTGRSIESQHPDYPATIPEAPYAIQVSSSTSLLIQGARGGTGMALQNPREFYDLANGHAVSDEPLPSTQAGDHLRYIRQLMIESDIYSRSIAAAMDRSTTQAEYGDDSLSVQLRAIARLINGGLGTGIYIVTLGGFDTHYGQAEPHALLLGSLSQAVSSFMQDIEASGNADRVVCLTYSEFGRRLSENGSAGTDHGAAAPQFVVGRPVQGGTVIGGPPDLENLDGRGDVTWKIDFRQLYATILEDWLKFDHAETIEVLGGDFTKLPLFRSTLDDVEGTYGNRKLGLSILESFPNPANYQSRISYVIPERGFVRLNLFTIDGHLVMKGVNGEVESGQHDVVIDLSTLPADDYLCLLEFSEMRKTTMLTVMR